MSSNELNGYNGTNWREARLDSSTRSLQVIDYAHHEIHGGSSFYVKNWADLGNGASYDLLIVTPNTTKWAHLVFEIATEAEATVTLYEGTTTSNDGTAVVEINRNRNSATDATTVITHTPTVSGTGTAIWVGKSGSGRASGGTNREANEIILKQNTKYLLRITNDTSNNNWAAWLLDWYEHTNQDV